MKFAKMHGIGNNYIYINCFEENVSPEDMPEITMKVANRNYGIGADGAIFICPVDGADAEMKMFNHLDGSYSRMCGNGIRCVAKYMYDKCLTDKTELNIISGGEVKTLKLETAPEKPGYFGKTFSEREDKMAVTSVTVDMGTPVFDMPLIPVSIPDDEIKSHPDITLPSGEKSKALALQPVVIDGRGYKITCVSVGNPHCVTFVDDVKGLDLVKTGPLFENHRWFPERINTEFIRIIDRKNIEMRVYERGSAETAACGTGATASACAAMLNGYTDYDITVHLVGGDLNIKWDKNNHLYMTGPAEFICEGEI